MTRKNKKIITVLVCLILSMSCFAKELTSFMDINFGTSKEKTISIMKTNGWELKSSNESVVSFYKDDAFFMKLKINSIMLTFSNNLLTAGTYITKLTQDNMQEVFKVHKSIHQIYEVQKMEEEEQNGMESIIGYTPSGNRIITTLAPGLCMFTFGINEDGKMETNSNKIEDYFPSKIGYSWTYNSSENKISEIRSLKNIQTDSNTGNTFYLIENYYPGIGSTSDLLLVDDKLISIVASKNAFGQYKENKEPYPVLLTLPKKHGKYIDSGDEVQYETYIGECSFDGNKYKDCIIVEEKIVYDGTILRTKKSYFAKGIGLVYVTLKAGNNSESVYLKLKEPNFK